MAAVRYVTSKSALTCIHLHCHVKPGVNKQREGIGSVSEMVIEVCVSARARDNEANKAVKALFSSVLEVPKTDVEVIRGLKSRDKIIAIHGLRGNEQTCIERIRQQLQTALDS